MPQHDEERLEVANTVFRSLAIENTLSPIQARSFVRCLQTSWHVPIIMWGENESGTQLDDARRLIHSAGIFQQIEGQSSSNALLCYRRAAELLEWLSRSNDQLQLTSPIELFAAGAYQLGGLPAMASGLLDQVEMQDKGSQLYAQFLRGDFDRVLYLVRKFWCRHAELTERAASECLLREENPEKISWYITVELVRSLGLISDSLRLGNEDRLERALSKLEAIERLGVRIFSNNTSLLITLLCSAAKKFKESSIYIPVRQFAELRPDRSQRLLKFARGQFRRGRGILWSSQRKGLEKLISESSFALCTPTGSGKTLVATLALVKELMLHEDDGGLAPLALYLVPSRALAGEVEAKLASELGQDLIITGLYGGTDWGLTDYWLTADRPTVLIATVEKADALMRYLGPVLLLRLRLLIIDEAHQVVPDNNEYTKTGFADHSNRSIRLEGFVARLLTHSPEIVRIALTAVAGGAAKPVARWVESQEEAEAVGSRYRSTRQIVGVFETRPGASGRMLLDLMNGQSLYVRGRVEPVYIRLRTPAMPHLPPVMRNSIYRFNALNVLWTALHLVDDERRVLISVAQQPERMMGWFKVALELDDWQEIANFEPPEDGNLLARFYKTLAACIDYCGEDSYEVALLNRGIATSHGQMPQRLRRLMTDLIDRRICPITVATSTLTEGVNLPFDVIFLTALRRNSFDPFTERPVINPISISEFNNLAGRAGRPGATKNPEGITLVAIPQQPSTSARSQLGIQRSQIAVLKNDYDNLKNTLLAAEIDSEAVNSPLALLLTSIAERAKKSFGVEEDQFLDWLETAIPVEVSEDVATGSYSVSARLADSIDELDSILLNSLEQLSQIENRDMEGAEAEEFLSHLWQNTFTHVAARQEAWLESAFIRRGRAVVEDIYPDAEERARLYQYGFTPCVGRRFEHVAPDILDIFKETADYGSASEEERLAVFEALGNLLSGDRGFGFRIRNTETDLNLLENWQSVLAWWVLGEGADSPEPKELRAWQRFVADNLEFRMGVAIGAVIAQAWSDGANDPLKVPSLDTWRETTDLPWFGFWARELLRWGTLDPFVAFAMAQSLAPTRRTAADRRPEFEAWLQQEYEGLDADDLIDPQLFQKWQQSLPSLDKERPVNDPSEVELTGTTGQRGLYQVLPVRNGDYIKWIDASGYELAKSQFQLGQLVNKVDSQDFELNIDNGKAVVQRTFLA
jgi:hypothetical protein